MNPVRSESIPRDWLILSIKWSGENGLVWYRTACAGYTNSLVYAGRYTAAEAREHTCDGVSAGVLLEDVIRLDAGLDRLVGVVVANRTEKLIAELVKASRLNLPR